MNHTNIRPLTANQMNQLTGGAHLEPLVTRRPRPLARDRGAFAGILIESMSRIGWLSR